MDGSGAPLMREGTCLGLELLAMIPCCCPTRLKATNTAVLITVLCWPDGWGSPLAPEHTAAAAHPHLPQHQATDLDAQGSQCGVNAIPSLRWTGLACKDLLPTGESCATGRGLGRSTETTVHLNRRSAPVIRPSASTGTQMHTLLVPG